MSDHLDDSGDITIVETPNGIALRILEDLSPDDDDDEDDDVEDAVGRFVWPAALPLLRYMCHDDTMVTTKGEPLLIIVELGAGCGVLGMGLAAEAFGTSVGEDRNNETNNNLHVILTDHDSDWLQRNVALNETVIREAANNSKVTMAVTRLDWKNSQDIATVRNMVQEHLSLNSNSNSNNELMIVGSDILYNHNSHKALAFTLYQLSESQPTRILLGFPDRNNDEQSFLLMAREFFGEDAVPSSKPIINHKRKVNKRGKTMDLRVIDFKVNS